MRPKKKSSSNFSLHVPIANITCELLFEKSATFSYFKKRFHSISKNKILSMKIVITESPKEYSFTSYPDTLSCKINKEHVSSLDQIFFIITALVQYQAIKHNIIFLHASSIVKNENAYLFIAPSGSGKSTIAHSVSDKYVLSDDVAVLKKVKDKFFIFSSPFDNKKRYNTRTKEMQLHKIFFIKQASFTKFVEERSVETIREILRNNLLFLWLSRKNKNEEERKRETALYALGLDLLSSSKIETLYFTKDLNFMSLL